MADLKKPHESVPQKDQIRNEKIRDDQQKKPMDQSQRPMDKDKDFWKKK